MAKADFLQNLWIARSLLTHRVQTDSSGLDPHWMEDRLNSAAIWLTPSAVKGFDVREFQELRPELRIELKENVERFLRVAKQVPPTKPATTEQLREAKTALEKVLQILDAYMPSHGEVKQIEEALQTVEFPDFVLSYFYEVGADSTGDPAVWIWIIVEDEAANRADFTVTSMEIERKIWDALTAAGSERWPFVRFRTASEQRALRAGWV